MVVQRNNMPAAIAYFIMLSFIAQLMYRMPIHVVDVHLPYQL